MKDIAEKLALLVCQQCPRMDNEREIDYAARLYSVYSSCRDRISDLQEQEINELRNESYKSQSESSL